MMPNQPLSTGLPIRQQLRNGRVFRAAKKRDYRTTSPPNSAWTAAPMNDPQVRVAA
jgi:hypothetical protein